MYFVTDFFPMCIAILRKIPLNIYFFFLFADSFYLPLSKLVRVPNSFITAINEKSNGLTQQFMQATNEDIIDITCRVLLGKIDSNLHDVRDCEKWPKLYKDKDYSQTQKLAQSLRENPGDHEQALAGLPWSR